MTTHYIYFYEWGDGFRTADDVIESKHVYLECNKCGSFIMRHTDYYDKNSWIWRQLSEHDFVKRSAFKDRAETIVHTNHIKVNEYIRPKSRHEKQKGRFR